MEDKKKSTKKKSVATNTKKKKDATKSKKTAKPPDKTKKEPKAKPEGSGLDLPFKAGSAMGKAFLAAMKGTTEKEINALAKSEGVNPKRLFHALQMEAYLNKKWTCKVQGEKYKVQYPL